MNADQKTARRWKAWSWAWFVAWLLTAAALSDMLVKDRRHHRGGGDHDVAQS